MNQTSEIGSETELREIQLLIISANGLKNINNVVADMKPYAIAYVDKHRHASRTCADDHGGTNPTWNHAVTVKFRRDLLQTDSAAALNVDIFSDGRRRKKLVGSARVPLSELLDCGAEPGRFMTTQIIRRRSGKPHGLLNLWVPRSGVFVADQEGSLGIPRV